MVNSKKEVPVAVPNDPLIIFKRTVCLEISCSIPGVKRKMNTHDLDENADQGLIHVSKDLLDSPELKAISALDAKMMMYLRTIESPGAFLKRGMYLIANGLVGEVEKKLNNNSDDPNLLGLIQKRKALIKGFIAKYPELMAAARVRLKEHYDESQYPTAAELERCFKVSYRWFQLGMPENVKMINPDIFMQEQESNSFNGIHQALRQGFLQMLETINGSLNPGNGKKKKFKAVTVEKLLTFFDTFDKRNITDDAQLTKMVQEAKSLLVSGKAGTIKPEALAADLRDNDGFRKKIQGKFGSICKELASVTVAVTDNRSILDLDD